ncbi:hypothetical protein PRNP1_014826 [Phytophthora ramorum]
MVLTRAQAKAEAEAQAARGDEDDHVEDIYDRPSADAEYPDDETENTTEGPSRDTASALVVAEKPGANIFPGIEEHLEKLAGFFLAQTRYLVEGHAMLQSQQEGQSNVQSAALMAVQGSTETCIKQLMDKQLAIAGQFQEELMATQSAICEQLMAMQAQAGEQINKVNLLETQLAAKMDDTFQILTSRIQQLVEEQTAVRQHASTASENSVELVFELLEKSMTGINAHVEQSLERGLQVARDELRQEVCASAVISTGESALDAVKHLVAAEAIKSERRIEAQVQRGLTSFHTDIQLQVQRQADATSILRDQFQQHCDRAQLKQGSVGEGLRSDDAKELVRKEVDECMTTLQRQFHAVELQAVERERQANETELRQLQAVEHAREAELQAKEAEVNHGVTEVVGERLRDPAADILAEIKQSLERSVKTIIELISVAVDRYAQTKEEITTEIEYRGSVSEDDGDENYDELSEEDHYAQQRMRDALIRAQVASTPPISSLVVHVEGPLRQDGERFRNKYNHHGFPPAVQGRATPSHRVCGVVVAVGETADVLKTAGEPHRGNDTESAEVASWDGGRHQTVV